MKELSGLSSEGFFGYIFPELSTNFWEPVIELLRKTSEVLLLAKNPAINLARNDQSSQLLSVSLLSYLPKHAIALKLAIQGGSRCSLDLSDPPLHPSHHSPSVHFPTSLFHITSIDDIAKQATRGDGRSADIRSLARRVHRRWDSIRE